MTRRIAGIGSLRLM